MISIKKLAIGGIAASALLMSSAMAQSKGDQYFTKMDTDKDGKISAAEHAAAAKARFDKMDKNHDGKIVIADEIKEPKTKGHAQAQADIALGMLKTVDADGDGVITADEHAKAATARFEKMDTNKDGFLSKEEWAAGREMVKEKMAK